jgi:hypothetical protein
VRDVLQAAVARKPTEAERKQAVAELQAMEPAIKRDFPTGWSQLEEDLAEGHLEAAWENGFVSDDEWQSWADRLQRSEVWPQDVEAFVASRLGSV